MSRDFRHGIFTEESSIMKTRLSQQSPDPQAAALFDLQDEVTEDDAGAVEAQVTYRGMKISVKQALATMIGEEQIDAADIPEIDDWDVRSVRASFGPKYSDDSFAQFDPSKD